MFRIALQMFPIGSYESSIPVSLGVMSARQRYPTLHMQAFMCAVGISDPMQLRPSPPELCVAFSLTLRLGRGVLQLVQSASRKRCSVATPSILSPRDGRQHFSLISRQTVPSKYCWLLCCSSKPIIACGKLTSSPLPPRTATWN